MSSGGEERSKEPRYRFVEEIGRGGVGVIWRAHDGNLGREVALKVLREDHLGSREVLERFVEEAQIGGQLQHPGIVPVYELGTDPEGRPFFAMKLVRGETLASQLARRADPSEQRARFLQIFEQVCQTIAFAHARRVLHRDLKPANVMIGAFGEVQVVDWGFAKVLPKDAAALLKIDKTKTAGIIRTVRTSSEGSTHSQMGSIFGTPAYMPPEQANGDVDLLDLRSDVFALGAILCEILSGQPPYVAAQGDLLLQAARYEIRAARERLEQSSAEPFLVELCLRCLRREPGHRPSSAQVIATEIATHRAELEVRARSAELAAVASRVRFRAALAIGAVILAGLLGVGAFWMARIEDERRGRDAARERVSTALAAAERVVGEAQAATGDTSRAWDRALLAVEAAQRSADDDAVELALRARIEELTRSVSASRDAAHAEARRGALETELFAAIAELRVPLEHDITSADQRRGEAQRLAQAYARAFRTFLEGRSPGALSAAEIEALRVRPRARELGWALDDWALAASAERPLESEELRRIARELDPEPGVRAELRSLLHDPRAAAEELSAFVDATRIAALEPGGLHLLARALGTAGRTEAQIGLLRRAAQAHPRDPGLAFELGLALERASTAPWNEIAGHYQQARALAPENYRILHRLGLALRGAQRVREARELFELLCALDPEDPHWTGHAGELQLDDGAIELGIATMQRSIEAEPLHANGPYNLGSALFDLQRHAEAERWLREALRRDERFAEAHVNLGSVLRAQGDPEAALPSFRRALELAPELVEAEIGITGALHDLGRDAEAEPHARRAVELRAHDARAQTNFGIVALALGRPDDAEPALRIAVQLDPALPSPALNLCIALGALDRSADQLEAVEQLLQRFPRYADGWLRAGLVYGELDLDERAIACFVRSLELDPDLVSARINLGYRRAQRGEHADALACFETARAWLDERPSGFAEQWIPTLDEEIARMESALDRAEHLQALLAGATEAAEFSDEQEALAIARGAGRWAESLDLWRRISARGPLQGLRWRRVRLEDSAHAAQSATVDAVRDEARACVRAWLAEELAQIRSEGVPRAEAREEARYWLRRPSLSWLRDEVELARLADDEAAAFSALWRALRRALQG